MMDMEYMHKFFELFNSPHDNQENQLPYGMVKYAQYESAGFSSQVKKHLELLNFTNELKKYQFDDKIALDIGCATCRYPLYLSELGFKCTGYDIDSDAIEICKGKISQSNHSVNVQRKNIVNSSAELNKYSLITCMMGTFNHIQGHEKNKFFQWVTESLTEHGLLVLSIWNKDCDYNGFLNFYSKKEIKHLRENLLSVSEIKELTQENHLKIDHLVPFCHLPDDCYDYWDFNLEAFSDIEQNLKDVAKNQNQMYLIFIKKCA
jgi:2-polyprenyl-3-methyl-5-hydroxy-6-metoxy-1,4-benzoquinol methylase